MNTKNEQRAKGLIEGKFTSCIKAVTDAANDAKSYCEVAVRVEDEKDFVWLFGYLGYKISCRAKIPSANTVNLWVIEWV